MVRLLFLSVLLMGLLNLLCASSIVYADCIDNDRDGYGDPASPECIYPEWDCDDDPSDDAAQCPSQGGACVCGESECGLCAQCVNPGATEILGNGIDDDCNPNTPPGYTPGPANTAAAYGAESSLAVSGLMNQLILLLIPVSAVIFLRIVRRKS